MPRTSAKALGYLGWTEPCREEDLAWGRLAPGTLIVKAEALFPRIEEKEEK